MSDDEKQELQIWRNVLSERLNLVDLKALCFELDVEYENLIGENLATRIISFVTGLNQKGRLPELAEHIKNNKSWSHLHNGYYEELYNLKERAVADLDADQSPYRGMLAFHEEHASTFFGREALTSELVQRIQFSVGDKSQPSFLAVIGASGSGKSSLARAGMVPKLREAGWDIHTITPTANPLEAVAVELTRGAESVAAAKRLKDDLAETEEALHLWLKMHQTGNTPYLLLIDQFEETFTLCKNEEMRSHFVNNLLYALDPARKGNLVVLLTLRADFYAQVAWSDGLRSLLEKQQAFIGPMTRDDLQKAIEGPSYLTNDFSFQDGLVKQILDDVEGAKGGLPLLSHALLETWKLCEKRDDGYRMTLDGYQSVGGVQGAIAKTADEKYQSLNPQDQAIAKNIFTRLTELGEGKEDTRRRASLTELIPSDSNAEEVMQVLAQLATARLITTDKDQVDVTHEALIREWDRLQDWLDADRPGLRILEELNRAATYWEENEHHDEDLLTGNRLSNTLDWQTGKKPQLSSLEAHFLQKSDERVKQLAAEEVERQHREREQLEQIAEEQRLRAAEQENLAEEAEKRRRAEEMAREEAEKAQAQAEADAYKLRNRNRVAIGLVFLGFILAILSFYFFRDSQKNLANANIRGTEAANNLETATLSQGLAEQQKATAEASAMNARSAALTAGSRQALATGDINLSLALSLNALEISPSRTAWETMWEAAEEPASVKGFIGHDGEVFSIAISSDGKRMLSASSDNKVFLWDIDTGEKISEFIGHNDHVQDLAFHPDEGKFVSVSRDGSVIIWDIEQSAILRRWIDHDADVMAVSVSSDGKYIASGDFNGKILLWEIDSDKPVGELVGHLGNVTSLDFDSNNRLISSSWDDTVKVWDVERKNIIQDIDLGVDVTHVAVSPNAEMVLVGDTASRVSLWSLENAERIRIYRGHGSPVETVAWSLDGRLFVSGGGDNKVIIWSPNRDSPLYTLNGHSAVVWDVAFYKASYAPVSASRDGVIRLWQDEINNPNIIEYGNTKFKMAKDSKERFVIITSGSFLFLLDLNTNNIVETLTESDAVISSVAYSPKGNLMASGDQNGGIIWWDMPSGDVNYKNDQYHQDAIFGMSFSNNGELLASASDDKKLVLWNSLSKDVFRILDEGSRIWRSVSFNPQDNKILLSGAEDGSIYLWDIEIGEPKFILQDVKRTNVVSVEISPNGTQGITGDIAGNVLLWDLENGLLLNEFNIETGIRDVSFSANGELIFAAMRDETVTVWKKDNKVPIYRYHGHTNSVAEVEVLSSENFAISISSDGTVQKWRFPETRDEFIEWVLRDKFIPELSCIERIQYGLQECRESIIDQ